MQSMLLWPLSKLKQVMIDHLRATCWMPPDYWQTDNSSGLVMVIRNYHWLNLASRVLISTCSAPLVQTGERPQTNGWTDATKRIIAPATRSIKILAKYNVNIFLHLRHCMWISLISITFIALTLLVWRQEDHVIWKNSYKLIAWLYLWSEVQIICIWSSWCHCHCFVSCFTKWGMFYASGTDLNGMFWKKAVKWMSIIHRQIVR